MTDALLDRVLYVAWAARARNGWRPLYGPANRARIVYARERAEVFYRAAVWACVEATREVLRRELEA